MKPKYTLKYFNVTGLAEPIRYLFAYGNIDYEDFRFEYEEWKNYKPKTPFGQVPILEIDGRPMNQSIAICRYLAKQLNLVGDSPLDEFEIDVTVDTFTNFRHVYSDYFREQDEEKKAKRLEYIKNTHNHQYMPKFQEVVRKNGGYFVCGKLTWADIYFSALCDLWSNVIKEPVLTGYPDLMALKEKVENLPGIKEYREKRPKTFV